MQIHGNMAYIRIVYVIYRILCISRYAWICGILLAAFPSLVQVIVSCTFAVRDFLFYWTLAQKNSNRYRSFFSLNLSLTICLEKVVVVVVVVILVVVVMLVLLLILLLVGHNYCCYNYY